MATLPRTINSALRSPVRQILQSRSLCSPTNRPPEIETPGLSKNVVAVPNTEVGPGASKKSQYKNPEYFCYNRVSYFEAEIEMSKYRLPQPSNEKSGE